MLVSIKQKHFSSPFAFVVTIITVHEKETEMPILHDGTCSGMRQLWSWSKCRPRDSFKDDTKQQCCTRSSCIFLVNPFFFFLTNQGFFLWNNHCTRVSDQLWNNVQPQNIYMHPRSTVTFRECAFTLCSNYFPNDERFKVSNFFPSPDEGFSLSQPPREAESQQQQQGTVNLRN